MNRIFFNIFLAGAFFCAPRVLPAQQRAPNIILIYADDLGWGDLSCYGATQIKTPNVDKLAASGRMFRNAYASSATCTPSRYSMLTGQYAWRKPNTGIAAGNASLVIDPETNTLADVFQSKGYHTGVIGKWHLGLGGPEGPDWNGVIKPGPMEIGFSEAFILPATGDRVPCIYMENNRLVGVDKNDPVYVDYKTPFEGAPTGKTHPELLKMMYSHGHDQTIVNGISRIGYMKGGKKAWWKDEEMADVLVGRAKRFISGNKTQPFFLYFSTQDIHVPRAPHSRFEGKSGMGPRGDAILQFDWCVGEIMKMIDSLGIASNTMILLSSDNGPVLDDGYVDQAVELLNGHTPSGNMRGGKYSAFEAGTRVPFIVRWPGKIKPGTTEALISQVDLFASFARLTGYEMKNGDAPDSFDMLALLTGASEKGRNHIVQQGGPMALVQNGWKYIEPRKGPAINKNTGIELGNAASPQLYHLSTDPGEKHNLASEEPGLLKELQDKLLQIKNNAGSRYKQ